MPLHEGWLEALLAPRPLEPDGDGGEPWWEPVDDGDVDEGGGGTGRSR